MLRSILHGAAGLAAVSLSLPVAAQQTADVHERAAVVAGELGTIAEHLRSKPQMALDFTDVSGEYCLNTWLAGGEQMLHFAVDPSGTQEDVIEFVEADSLASQGLNVEELPRMPDKLGAMKPGQWYYLPAGAPEPHHGTEFPFPLLLRASNLE